MCLKWDFSGIEGNYATICKQLQIRIISENIFSLILIVYRHRKLGYLHPNDLIPILMSDGSSPVSYMPQGAFHHLGDEQIRPVPCIDGHIAGPLSAIVGTCRQNAVANIVTDRLHGQFPRFVHFWTICFEHHPRAGTMRPARNQYEECQKSCNGIFHIFMISLKVHRGLSIGTSAVNFSWKPDVSYGIVRYTLTG